MENKIKKNIPAVAAFMLFIMLPVALAQESVQGSVQTSSSESHVTPTYTKTLGSAGQKFIDAAKNYIKQKLGEEYYNQRITFESGTSYEDCIQNSCTVRNEIGFIYKTPFETDGDPTRGPPPNNVYVTVDDKGAISNYRGPLNPYKFQISKDEAIANAKSYGLKNITGAGIATASGISKTNGYEIVWAVSSNDLAGECRDIGEGSFKECIYKGVYVDVDTGKIRGEFTINPLIMSVERGGGNVILDKTLHGKEGNSIKKEPQTKVNFGFFRKMSNWLKNLFS